MRRSRSAAVLVILAVMAACSGDDEEAEPVDAAPPDSWRIVYTVEAGDAIVTDVVTVRRPFDSRLETYRGDKVEGEPGSVQVSAFARLRQQGAGGAPTVLAVPPGLAASDVRLDVVIPAALERGLLLLRAEDEVDGRPCRVYRSGQLLTGGVLAVPAEDDYADSCVDAAGLVLQETLVSDGEMILRRTATDVEIDPETADEAFDAGEPTVPAASGGGSVRPLAPGTGRPGSFWVLDAPPDGFRSCGRFSVVPPQLTDPGGGADQRVASVAQVFVRGRDLLVVDQGATLQGDPPFEIGRGEPADLGELGDGELVLGSQTSEARALLDGGGYVRVFGTLPPDDLLEIAGGLQVEDQSGPLDVLTDERPACRTNLR
ncbi:MAG: hypothetical protein ACRDJP_06825 [Actinomycetota bacterium]